jgi:hypothetical protein
MSLIDAAGYTTMIMAQNPDWCAKRMENFEKYITENSAGAAEVCNERKDNSAMVILKDEGARRMATKRVCDRCGAEINPTSSATYVNVRSAFHEESPDIELCCSCAMQIKEWLKSSVEEDKKDGKIH